MAVIGWLRQSSWATAEGEKRSRLQVVADEVEFLDRPRTHADNGPAQADEARDGTTTGRRNDRAWAGAR